MLQEVIGNNIDVLLISETKLDASFPSSQFILDRFTPPYRVDRMQHGGATRRRYNAIFNGGYTLQTSKY